MNPKKAGSLFFTIIALTIGVNLLLSLIMLLPGAPVEEMSSATGVVFSLLLSEGLILVPTLIWAARTPGKKLEQFGFHRVHIRTILLAILLMLVCYPPVVLLNLISQFFTANVVQEISGPMLNLPEWFGILLLGIVGPFIEELVFRGYIFHSLRASGRVAASVVLSGIMFGLMHLNFNQACYAIFLGIVFAAAVEASGSIVTSMAMHMAFNSAEVAMLYAVSENTDEMLNGGDMTIDGFWQEFGGTGSVSLPVVIIGAVVLTVFLTVLCLIFAVLILNGMAHLEGRPGMMDVRRNRVICRQRKGGASAQSGTPICSYMLVLGIILAIAFIVVSDFLPL